MSKFHYETASGFAIGVKVKEIQTVASLNLVWELAAGPLDLDWREQTDEEKDKLRQKAEAE